MWSVLRWISHYPSHHGYPCRYRLLVWMDISCYWYTSTPYGCLLSYNTQMTAPLRVPAHQSPYYPCSWTLYWFCDPYSSFLDGQSEQLLLDTGLRFKKEWGRHLPSRRFEMTCGWRSLLSANVHPPSLWSLFLPSSRAILIDWIQAGHLSYSYLPRILR